MREKYKSMKKKILFCIYIVLISIHSAFAVEYLLFGDFVANNDAIYWTGNRKVDRKKLYIGEDGWYHFEDKLIIFQPSGYERFVQATLLNLKYPLGNQNKLNYWVAPSAWEKPELVDAPDVAFSASSFLKEEINGKKISYSPENLSSYMKNISKDPFCSYAEEFENKGVWNYSHRPWVEGVDDYGIGEKLTARFSEPIYSFVILNGYVDPLHPDYYKKNSRVRKIKVTDAGSKKIYVFELKDEVIEQRFILDEPAEVLEFEILDVYKGSKYKDTCITGLFGETYPAFLYRSDGEDEVIRLDAIDLIQTGIKDDIGYELSSDIEMGLVSVKDKTTWSDATEYFVSNADRMALYELIVEYCNKNNYDKIEYTELYDDNDLKLYLKYRNDFSFDSKIPVKSIEYIISSSIPLFNDSDVITDISEKEYTINFKGFYDGWSCYYHFITGLTLKFNFTNGKSITYEASESDLKKILKHYDISAKIQYEH